MIMSIAIILLVLWVLGLITGYTLNGFIHILLALAIIVILYNLITGRRAY
jgi:cation transporter-like permease